jgi:hypothetical protein
MSSYFAEAEDNLIRAQPLEVLGDDCNPAYSCQLCAAGRDATVKLTVSRNVYLCSVGDYLSFCRVLDDTWHLPHCQGPRKFDAVLITGISLSNTSQDRLRGWETLPGWMIPPIIVADVSPLVQRGSSNTSNFSCNVNATPKGLPCPE